MIALAVVNGQNDALNRCQNRASEAGESIGEFRSHQRTRGDRRCAPSVCDRQEIDSVRRSEGVRAMTGHTVRRAILHQPVAGEWIGKIDWRSSTAEPMILGTRRPVHTSHRSGPYDSSQSLALYDECGIGII